MQNTELPTTNQEHAAALISDALRQVNLATGDKKLKSRDLANTLLKGQSPGTFLVRKSESGGLMLAIVNSNGNVDHHRLDQNGTIYLKTDDGLESLNPLQFVQTYGLDATAFKPPAPPRQILAAAKPLYMEHTPMDKSAADRLNLSLISPQNMNRETATSTLADQPVGTFIARQDLSKSNRDSVLTVSIVVPYKTSEKEVKHFMVNVGQDGNYNFSRDGTLSTLEFVQTHLGTKLGIVDFSNIRPYVGASEA
jgi:hypothetical protein